MNVARITLLSLSVVVVALTSAARAADKDADKVKAEMKALEGTWNLVTAEADGKELPKDSAPPKLEIKDGKLLGFGPTDMTITVDPSKTPKHMTLVTKVKDKDITVNSIYELNKDELKLVIPLVEKGKGPENTRPENFDTKGKPVMLLKLKRAEAKP